MEEGGKGSLFVVSVELALGLPLGTRQNKCDLPSMTDFQIFEDHIQSP